jgi:hypothetical protein
MRANQRPSMIERAIVFVFVFAFVFVFFFVGAQHAAPQLGKMLAVRVFVFGSIAPSANPVIPSGAGRRFFLRFAPAKCRPAQSRNLS